MNEQDKQLLLRDLCARLPYGVKVQNVINGSIYDLKEHLYCLPGALTTNFKPYLRPKSFMSKEEKNLLNNILEYQYCSDDSCMCEASDYLNSIHVDYRGLIPMGLALPAPEGMYKIK